MPKNDEIRYNQSEKIKFIYANKSYCFYPPQTAIEGPIEAQLVSSPPVPNSHYCHYLPKEYNAHLKKFY